MVLLIKKNFNSIIIINKKALEKLNEEMEYVKNIVK